MAPNEQEPSQDSIPSWSDEQTKPHVPIPENEDTKPIFPSPEAFEETVQAPMVNQGEWQEQPVDMAPPASYTPMENLAHLVDMLEMEKPDKQQIISLMDAALQHTKQAPNQQAFEDRFHVFTDIIKIAQLYAVTREQALRRQNDIESAAEFRVLERVFVASIVNLFPDERVSLRDKQNLVDNFVRFPSDIISFGAEGIHYVRQRPIDAFQKAEVYMNAKNIFRAVVEALRKKQKFTARDQEAIYDRFLSMKTMFEVFVMDPTMANDGAYGAVKSFQAELLRNGY